MSPSIPAAIATPLALWLIAGALLFAGVLFLLHLHHNRQRRRAGKAPKSLAGHVATHAPHHAAALLVLAAGVALLLGVGVAYVVFHGGARFDPHRHQRIHLILPKAGGRLPAGAGNLSYFLPPVLNQGNTNACGSFASTEALYAERRMRGELPPEPFSPWHTYWYAAGGRDDPTTLEQQRDSIQAHGIEGLSHWPVMGPPDALDPSYTTQDTRATLQYIYYGGQGDAGLRAIQTEIQAGYPVILLVDWRTEGLQSGLAVYDLSGAHSFYHFVTAWQVRPGGIMIRNSWGGSWGIQGDALLTDDAIRTNVLAAAIMLPGPAVVAWLPAPPPTPVPTARPRATTRPTPAPTRTATPRPVPGYWGVYVVSRATNLRAAPHAGSRIVRGLPHGTRLRGLGAGSGAYVHASEHGLAGWAPLAAVTRTK